MKTNELKKALKMLLPMDKEQTVTPFIQGKPGIGKSAIVKAFAKEHELMLIDYRLSQTDNTDLKGIPHVDDASKFCYWAAPEELPLANNPKYKGTKGILFLDEFNRATPDVIQSCFQLIYDHEIGQNKLAPNWYIVAAGNLGNEDGCDVIELDTAIRTGRLFPLRTDESLEDWLEWAEANEINPNIIGFLRAYGDTYFYFKEGDTFITPRQWHQFSNIIADNSDMDIKDVTTFIGRPAIGSASAIFLQYLRDNETLSGKDVLEKFDKAMEKKIKAYEASRTVQLDESIIDAIKERDGKLSEKNLKNLDKYLWTKQDDEMIGLFVNIKKAAPTVTVKLVEIDEKLNDYLIQCLYRAKGHKGKVEETSKKSTKKTK